MTAKEKVNAAYEIGKETFNNGGTIIPCLSVKLMELLKNMKVGENAIEIMESFQEGFINA